MPMDPWRITRDPHQIPPKTQEFGGANILSRRNVAPQNEKNGQVKTIT